MIRHRSSVDRTRLPASRIPRLPAPFGSPPQSPFSRSPEGTRGALHLGHADRRLRWLSRGNRDIDARRLARQMRLGSHSLGQFPSPGSASTASVASELSPRPPARAVRRGRHPARRSDAGLVRATGGFQPALRGAVRGSRGAIGSARGVGAGASGSEKLRPIARRPRRNWHTFSICLWKVSGELPCRLFQFRRPDSRPHEDRLTHAKG